MEDCDSLRPGGWRMENGTSLHKTSWCLETNPLRKRGEVKWQLVVQRVIQDVPMMGFGAWIIWKQVYATSPNGYLALIGFACMFPAARSAVITILSLPGQSSSPSPPPPEPPSKSSKNGGTGDKGTL